MTREVNGVVTEKDILHKEYLDICNEIRIDGLEAYNIKQLLYNDVFFAQSVSWKEVIKTLLKTVLYDSARTLFLCIDRRNDDMVLVSSKWNRRDHDGYWKRICDEFEEYTRISLREEDYSVRTWLRISFLKNIAQNICDMKSIYKGLERIRNKKHRLYLVNRLMRIKRIHTLLVELDLSPKVATCFFDSGFFENVTMQFFKSRGTVTATNQHGQPLFKSHDYDRMNQSQILNFKCDYFLAKGEFTRKQFVEAGTDGNKVVVVGSFNKEKECIRSYHRRNAFCIFLNCIALPKAREANTKMLEIAKELSRRTDCKYYVKLHPSDSIEYYRDFSDDKLIDMVGKEKTMSELAGEIDFGIFNESAIFLDMLDNKVKPFYWDSGVHFPLVEDKDSIFSDVSELQKKVVEWMEYSDFQKDSFFSDISGYYNGYGDAQQNIRNFIQKIIMDN